MEIVIISRRRPKICAEATARIMKSALVSIAEEEVDDYVSAGIERKRMLIHPNDVVGVCKKRNWVLRNVKDEVCVQFDDDFLGLMCYVGERPRTITDEESILQVLRNTEQGAREVGTVLFGFYCIGHNLRNYVPSYPFRFVGYPAGTQGMIGREVFYDENNMLHDDVDIALQVIKKFRVVWIDTRFGDISAAGTGQMKGGRQGIMTQKKDKEEREYLKIKWGKYYKMGKWGLAGIKSSIVVERKQKLLIIS